MFTIEKNGKRWVLVADGSGLNPLPNLTAAIVMSGGLAFVAIKHFVRTPDWDWHIGVALGVGCLVWFVRSLRRRPLKAGTTVIDPAGREVRIEPIGRGGAAMAISFDEVARLDFSRAEEHGTRYATLILRRRSGRPVLVGTGKAESRDANRLDDLERRVAEIRAETGIPS